MFKGGDFAGAVKSYTESILRDPSDPRGYNNRAAAYTKLVAFPEALKDANEAIKIDPKFGMSFSLYLCVSVCSHTSDYNNTPQSRVTSVNPMFFSL